MTRLRFLVGAMGMLLVCGVASAQLGQGTDGPTVSPRRSRPAARSPSAARSGSKGCSAPDLCGLTAQLNRVTCKCEPLPPAKTVAAPPQQFEKQDCEYCASRARQMRQAAAGQGQLVASQKDMQSFQKVSASQQQVMLQAAAAYEQEFRECKAGREGKVCKPGGSAASADAPSSQAPSPPAVDPMHQKTLDDLRTLGEQARDAGYRGSGARGGARQERADLDEASGQDCFVQTLGLEPCDAGPMRSASMTEFSPLVFDPSGGPYDVASIEKAFGQWLQSFLATPSPPKYVSRRTSKEKKPDPPPPPPADEPRPPLRAQPMDGPDQDHDGYPDALDVCPLNDPGDYWPLQFRGCPTPSSSWFPDGLYWTSSSCEARRQSLPVVQPAGYQGARGTCWQMTQADALASNTFYLPGGGAPSAYRQLVFFRCQEPDNTRRTPDTWCEIRTGSPPEEPGAPPVTLDPKQIQDEINFPKRPSK